MDLRKGFTLLELVVVVAIIGILSATVLIPNLLRFREKGAASRAASDMEVIMRAVELSAVEGCNTDLVLKSGQKFECNGQTYVQNMPSPPASNLNYWIKKGSVDKNLQTDGATINPQIRDFSFYANGFANDANAKFLCSGGSCWCQSDLGPRGCEQ